MTHEDLRKQAVTQFKEIVNRYNVSEEIKTDEDNKEEQKKGATKYNFLKENHLCTYNAIPVLSKIEEGNIYEDADVEDFGLESWCYANYFEL